MLALLAAVCWLPGRSAQRPHRPAENVAYAAAYRLISQLRLVARQLSGGLDPVSLGAADARTGAAGSRRSTAARSTSGPSGGRLSPVAFLGADRLDWDVEQPALRRGLGLQHPDAVAPGA